MGHTIVEYDSLSDEIKKLIDAANEVRKLSHCPYSKFEVGSALQCSGTDIIFSGCNIENAVLSPSICAERSAICVAVSQGFKKIDKCAVVAYQPNQFTAPCGVCRQSLLEFQGDKGDVDLYLCKPEKGQVLCTKLSEILPLSFLTYEEN